MTISCILALIALLYAGFDAAPLDIPSLETLKFMQRFGYLESGNLDTEALYKDEAIHEAITTMQKYGAINQTGVLDKPTLELMEKPRCGVPDIRRKRPKRYIVGAEGWRSRTITYFIANWSPKLGEDVVVRDIQRAFNSWSGYARLNFTMVQDPSADIIIAFGRGPHGDPYPFDGPGYILAHAYYPYELDSYGGDVHFDEDEEWKPKLSGPYDDGVDFYSVAVHEIGHSLGLAHSHVPSSIMFPYYKGYQQSDFQLDYDDILGMYELYISRTLDDDNDHTRNVDDNDDAVTGGDDDVDSSRSDNETGNDDDVDSSRSDNETGNDDDIDSSRSDNETGNGDESSRSDNEDSDGGGCNGDSSCVTESSPLVPSSTGYTFIGDDESVDDHKSHQPTEHTPAKNKNICQGDFDAIAVLRQELFLFKGEMLWRFADRGHILPGYPVAIRQFFWQLPESVASIDATYERHTDGSIIFFSGKKFWIFNGDSLIENSPQPLTKLGLPKDLEKVDAAFVWGKNGKTFFFSGNLYWRFNETTTKMDPGYPRDFSRWRGIPPNINTAMTWTDGLTYFFKDDLFWRFNNVLIKADDDYPQPAPEFWIGCN